MNSNDPQGLANPSMQVPVTVLTGYLGAGKTTLLNRILSDEHGKKFAVIVNEFGEIGIDNDLVVNADEEVFEMNNGCICCTVRGDLIRIIEGLTKRWGKFDAIIVETTGLAYPGPVVQTFFVDEDVRARTRLDAIVTVVDARHLLGEIEHAKEISEQIAFADVIIVNKIDLVDAATLSSVRTRISRINPQAKVMMTERCQAPVTDILHQDAFNLARILDADPDFLDEHHEDHHPAGHDHDEDHVGHGPEGHSHHDHHDHEHDEHVQSLSLSTVHPLDPDRFFGWVQDVTQQHGTDLLRMKGVLSFAGDDERYVIQAVHMLVEGEHQRPWRSGEARVSKLVFIGRDLPHDRLRQAFEECFADRPGASATLA